MKKPYKRASSPRNGNADTRSRNSSEKSFGKKKIAVSKKKKGRHFKKVEEEPKLIVLEDDPEREIINQEREAMFGKLAKFLEFKRRSKVLAHENSLRFDPKQKKRE